MALLQLYHSERELTIHRAVYEKFKDGTVKDISDELPFEIPDGWAWVKLEHCLISLHTGLNPRRFFRLNTADAKNYYVTIRELKNNKVVFSERTDRINDEAIRLCNNRSDLDEGDVLFAGTGSIGVVALVETKPKNWNIKEGVYALKPFQPSLFPRFLLYILQSETIRSLFMQKAVGSTIASVPMKSLISLVIPLPPLAEQKRIVAKIEKLMPLVEEYGRMEETRLQLDADLPATLEKSILQEAIQGKLVPQDPNDEPASELLKRIAAERKALVKSGKLKRDKVESVIFRGSDRLAYETRNGETVCIQDEIPFEIPDSWEWVRLGSLITFISGVSYDKDDVAKSGIRVLRGGNIKRDGKLYLWEDDVFLPETYSNNENEIHKDDVVIVAATGSSTVIGRAAVASADMARVQIGAFLRIARPLFTDISAWIALIFHSPFYRQHIQEKAKGTNIRNLKAEYITDFIIPLPPLYEQRRIVKRVEELKATARTLVTF